MARHMCRMQWNLRLCVTLSVLPQVLRRWLHARPHKPQAWLLNALVLLHAALSDSPESSLHSAQKLLTSAGAVLDQYGLKEEKALLLLALSECHLHQAVVRSNSWPTDDDLHILLTKLFCLSTLFSRAFFHSSILRTWHLNVSTT